MVNIQKKRAGTSSFLYHVITFVGALSSPAKEPAKKRIRTNLPAYLPGDWVDVLHKTEEGLQWFCGKILNKAGRTRTVAFTDGETATINLVHKDWRPCRHPQPMSEGVCEESLEEETEGADNM